MSNLDGIVLKRSWAGEVRNVSLLVAISVNDEERGQIRLSLASARLRHIAGTRWSTKRYLNMKLLKQRDIDVQTRLTDQAATQMCERLWTLPDRFALA